MKNLQDSNGRSSLDEYIQTAILIDYSLDLYFHEVHENDKDSYYFTFRTNSSEPLDQIEQISQRVTLDFARIIIVDFGKTQEGKGEKYSITANLDGYLIQENKVLLDVIFHVVLVEANTKSRNHWEITYQDLAYLLLKYPEEVEATGLSKKKKEELKELEKNVRKILRIFENKKIKTSVTIEGDIFTGFFGFEMIYNYIVEYHPKYSYQLSFDEKKKIARHHFCQKE